MPTINDKPAIPPDGIPFNNSCLADLACSRRYVYRVVLGAQVSTSPKLAAGKLFHKFMEVIEPGDEALFMVPFTEGAPVAERYDTDAFKQLRAQIPTTTAYRLAMLAAETAKRIAPQLAAGRREHYFSLPQYGADCTKMNMVGTIDLHIYDAAANTLTIIDYKTTERPFAADLFQDYALSSQMFFYAIALASELSLPPDTRIFKQYIHAGYGNRHNTQQIERHLYIPQPEELHQQQLREFAALFAEKSDIALFLWRHPELSTKEGMTNGACKYCPFRNICSLNDPDKEAAAINNWWLGFSPYNPKGFH